MPFRNKHLNHYGQTILRGDGLNRTQPKCQYTVGCPKKSKSYILRSTTLYIFQSWPLSHHKKNQNMLMQIELRPAIFIIQRKFGDLQRKDWIFTFSSFSPITNFLPSLWSSLFQTLGPG